MELPVINHYSDLSDCCFNTGSTYEDISPLLESFNHYLCPVPDSYPYQDDTFYNLSSLYENEVYPAVNHYEQDGFSCNIWRNWDGEYGSCFGYSSYVDDNSNYEHGSGLEKTENWIQSEENGDSYIADFESTENKFSYDDSPWSACDSLLGYVREEDSDYFDNKNTADLCSYGKDETGLCEGIFGYWPCLIQKQQIAYREY